MSLFGVIGKVLTAGADIITGNIPGAVGTIGSIIKPGAGAVPVTTASTTPTIRRAVDMAQGFAPAAPSIFPTALPSIDSVKVTAKGVVTPIGTVGSTTATAYLSSGAAGAMCGVKGHHLNKTSYTLKSGQRVEKGTKCVSNRRRNALNPRALNRAVSRVAAAKRYAKLLDRIEIKAHHRRR